MSESPFFADGDILGTFSVIAAEVWLHLSRTLLNAGLTSGKFQQLEQEEITAVTCF